MKALIAAAAACLLSGGALCFSGGPTWQTTGAAGSAQATTCVVIDPVWVANQQVTPGYEVCLPVA